MGEWRPGCRGRGAPSTNCCCSQCSSSSCALDTDSGPDSPVLDDPERFALNSVARERREASADPAAAIAIRSGCETAQHFAFLASTRGATCPNRSIVSLVAESAPPQLCCAGGRRDGGSRWAGREQPMPTGVIRANACCMWVERLTWLPRAPLVAQHVPCRVMGKRVQDQDRESTTERCAGAGSSWSLGQLAMPPLPRRALPPPSASRVPLGVFRAASDPVGSPTPLLRRCRSKSLHMATHSARGAGAGAGTASSAVNGAASRGGDHDAEYDADGEPIFRPAPPESRPEKPILRSTQTGAGGGRRGRGVKRRICFADERGHVLEKVHYSDKLHYSTPDFGTGDRIVPCCTLQ